MLFDLTELRQTAATTTDESGWFSLSPGIPAPSLPQQFHLGQNYPNPFNPSTTIPFQLPVSTRVRLEVFNLLGQRVTTLVDGELPAGFHTFRWDGTDAAGRPAGAGLYLYRLRGGGTSLTHRMVLIDGQAGSLPLPSDHGALSTGGEAAMETAAPVLGLTVSGPGLVPYVDPAFRPEAGKGPVDLVVEEQDVSRGKAASGGLLGDVDNNGLVDIVDALLLMVHTLDLDQPSVPVPTNADLSLGDVNRDGTVDISDALSVLAWLADPLDPSLPPGIGEPAVTIASLSPDPATISFRPDGGWHRFTVLSSEQVEIVVNPAGSERNLEITVLGGLSTHCPPEQTDRFTRNNGQFVYLAACREGTGTVELRRKSDGSVLRTYTFPAGGAARMYWTGHDVRMVRRADVDGSNIQDLVPTGYYSAGLALDLAGGKMYWTDVGTGRINRADLDGSNTEHLVTTGVGSINWLALDVPGGKMYWTDWTTDRIQRANLDGSGIEDLVTTGLVAPHGLALDLAAGKMYWTDNGAGRIQRANLDGSGTENLVTGLGVPRGLALDAAAGKMYWTDAGTHKIQRASLDGSNVEDLVTSGVNAPHGLALDLVRGWMYWTDLVTDKIQRANLDGSNVEDLVTTGLSRPWGLALDTSYTGRPGAGAATLWPDPSTTAIENDGRWHEFRVRSGEPVVVISNPGGTTPRVGSSVTGSASSGCPAGSEEDEVRRDGESIYLAGCGAGTATVELRRASDQTLLRTYTFTISEALPAATGTLASKMYWTSPGKIQRADRDGTNVEDLVTFGSPRNLALDMLAGKMYWTDPGTRKIWRADLDGSQAESPISSGLISPVALALDVDAGKIYWTDSGFNRIQRANLDGSRIEYLVSLGLHSPEGLALDADGGKIYWSDYGTNKIQRANLDGSQVEDLVTTGLSSPEGLALDAEAGKIYWTDYSTDKIQRANLDGSRVEDLVTTGLSIPRGLTLEPAAGKMYWADSGTGKIQRANLDGSQVEDLLSSESSAPLGLALASAVASLSPNPEATFPRDGVMRRFTVQASEPIVVVANPAGTSSKMLVAESTSAFNECPAQQEDSLTRRHGQAVYLGGCSPGPATVELRRASDQAVLRTYTVRVSGKLKLYWTNASRQDRIQRADIDGTNVEDLVTTGLSEPIDLALDVTEGKMYWTDQGTDKIQRANLDGSDIEDLVTTLDYPVGLALDLGEGKMYWTDLNTDKIQRANLDGSQVEDLVTTGLSRPRGIALDTGAGKMYWMDQGTDKIQRANLDGSDIEDLVSSGLNDVDRLALDLAGGKMYWTDSRARKIQRANLDGSDVEDLVAGLSEPRGIALDLDGGKMYWTDSGTDRIQSADLDGSNIQTIVTGIAGPTSIALE